MTEPVAGPTCSCSCHDTGERPQCAVELFCRLPRQNACIIDHGVDSNCHPNYRKATDGYLCGWHAGKLDANLREIVTDWVDLQLIREAGTAPKETGPRTGKTKSASPPAPANLEVLVQRDHRTKQAPARSDITGQVEDRSKSIPNVLTFAASWCQLVAEERGITGPLPKSAVGQIQLISRHLDWAMEQPWIDDLWTETRLLLRTLRTALRDHTHKYVGACITVTADTACGGNVLIQNGHTTPVCSRCKRAYVTPLEMARLAVANDLKRKA